MSKILRDIETENVIAWQSRRCCMGCFGVVNFSLLHCGFDSALLCLISAMFQEYKELIVSQVFKLSEHSLSDCLDTT